MLWAYLLAKQSFVSKNIKYFQFFKFLFIRNFKPFFIFFKQKINSKNSILVTQLNLFGHSRVKLMTHTSFERSLQSCQKNTPDGVSGYF